MRVALISEHASPLAAIAGVDAGGQNVHVAELAAALHRQGHAVTVYTRRDAPDLPETVATPRGFTVVHVPAGPARHIPKDELLPFMRPFGLWLAARWAATGAPDIVHAHFWMSGVAAEVATSEVPAPVVQTFHALGSVKRRYQTTADTSPPVRVDIERRLALFAARVIAQCTDEVDELAALGVPRSKVSIVASGVDAQRFTPVGRAAPRTPGRRRILTVGRLVPRKGFDELVHALPDLPDAEVVVAGGPPGELDTDPEARRLRSLAEDLGVGDRLRLLGAVPPEQMPQWYRSADVVACTPWYEPFGLTPLEAMACGVPVVARAVGGLRDSVVDGSTGFLVPPGDRRALVEALGAVLADEGRRREFGAAARLRAVSRYGWSRQAAAVASVYADLHAPREVLVEAPT
ncbi:MAG: glycosyltransferase [Micromonosporaceae bacterium]|nr:glycosyltransferase [Micromonosporaceae bacterium]